MGIFDFLKKKDKKNDSKMVTVEPIIQSTIQRPTEPVKMIRHGNVSIEQININQKTVEMLHRSYIAFDVETTGLSPETDSIIELGAVRFEDGKPAAEFNSLVNAGVSISEAATKVNHITNQMLNSAPGEDEVYPKLLEFLGVASSGKIILCAHNASFDFRFLANTLRRLGYDGNYLYVDTLNLSRKYIKGLENYKQGTIEAYLGLSNSVAHRAVSDAKICGEILSRILIELDEEMN